MATNSINQQPVGKIISDITFADTGTFDIGNLPPKAVVTDIKVYVLTAFDSVTSDSLSIGHAAFGGTSADTDEFEAAIDLQSAGDASLTLLQIGQELSSELNAGLTATVTSVGGSLAAGAATIIVEYVQK